MPTLHLRLFAMIHVGINNDIVSKKNWSGLQKIASEVSAPGDNDPKTTMKRGSDAVKKLRTATSNNLHLSICILMDSFTVSLLHAINSCFKYAKEWYHEQNVRIRSATESRNWLMEQVSGDFYNHIRNTLAVMQDPSALENMKLIPRGCSSTERAPDHPDQITAVRLTYLVTRMIFSFILQRFTRFLWALAGWPTRGILLGHADSTKRKLIAEMILEDDKLDKKAHTMKATFYKAMNRRSLFRHVSVQQIVAALKFHGNGSDEIVAWASETWKTIGASKWSEDGICQLRRKETVGMSRTGTLFTQVPPRPSHFIYIIK